MANYTLTNGADSFPGGGQVNSGNDSINALDGADTVFAGLGNDTVLGGLGADLVNGEDGADLLYGDAGNDTLNGGAGNDTLTGGAGADVLDGGSGTNTASYAAAAAAIGVNLTSGTHTGDAAGDTYVSITRYDLSAFADVFVNDSVARTINGLGGADSLTGGTGNDIFFGGADNDSLVGGGGSDQLIGDAGADTLSGGLGADQLTGGAGADAFDGGDGVDQVNYTAAAAAVTVDLETGSGLFGDAQGDTYVSVETFNLSNHADSYFADTTGRTARGNGGADSLNGNNGLDTLDGGDGADRLRGYDGNDRLIGGLNNDTLDGGADIDTAVFSGSKFDWTVIDNGGGSHTVYSDLLPAETNSLSSIEVLEIGGETYALGGANNAPETRGSTHYIDIQTASSGGVFWYGRTGEQTNAFDADGDVLNYQLVADNTGPDIHLSYEAAGTAGSWMLTFGPGLTIGTYGFDWQVNDGTVDSNVSTISIVIYDSLEL